MYKFNNSVAVAASIAGGSITGMVLGEKAENEGRGGLGQLGYTVGGIAAGAGTGYLAGQIPYALAVVLGKRK